jgi:hypothetical protein
MLAHRDAEKEREESISSLQRTLAVFLGDLSAPLSLVFRWRETIF